MKIQKGSNQQSVRTGILYGIGVTAVIWISRLFTLDGDTKYSGNLTTSALMVGVLTCGVLLCYRRVYRIGQFQNLSLRQLALAGMFFSLSVGLIGGLAVYIDATFIDSNYAENALKASQAKWAANNFSKDAIAGQIELTDTFQRPWKWAATTGIFMIILSSFLFVTVGCLYRLIKNPK